MGWVHSWLYDILKHFFFFLIAGLGKEKIFWILVLGWGPTIRFREKLDSDGLTQLSRLHLQENH